MGLGAEREGGGGEGEAIGRECQVAEGERRGGGGLGGEVVRLGGEGGERGGSRHGREKKVEAFSPLRREKGKGLSVWMREPFDLT